MRDVEGRQVIQWASCCFSGEGTKPKHKQTMSLVVRAILGRESAHSGYLIGKKIILEKGRKLRSESLR